LAHRLCKIARIITVTLQQIAVTAKKRSLALCNARAIVSRVHKSNVAVRDKEYVTNVTLFY